MFTRNYRLLAYFVEVVNSGSIRGAARKLFVSAPVVSKAIADLEESLNSSLLIRQKNELALTDEGRKVYAHALDMTQAAVHALASVGDPGSEVSGHLDLNLPTELASTWLPDVLKQYSARHPAVTIEVFASDQTTGPVQREQIVIRAEFAARLPAVRETYFNYFPLCIVCRPELVDPRARSAQQQLDSVAYIGFSQADGSNTLSAVDNKSGREVSLRYNAGTTVNNAQVIKEMVLRGYGAGQLTENSVSSEIEQGRLRKLGDNYSFGYICQRLIFRDSYPSAAARAFRDLVYELEPWPQS